MSRRYCKHCQRTVRRVNWERHLATDIHTYFVERRPDEPDAEVFTVDSLAAALRDTIGSGGWQRDPVDEWLANAAAIIAAAKEASE